MKCLIFLFLIVFVVAGFSVHFSGKGPWGPLKGTIKIVVYNWGQSASAQNNLFQILSSNSGEFENEFTQVSYRIKRTFFVNQYNVVVCVFSPVIVF